MDTNLRQIAKHSATFGLGQLLFRLSSVILLPVYTRHLSPTDYGVMALLDITTNLFAIVIGAGVPAAAARAHFHSTDAEHHDRVWWTAVAMTAAFATLVVAPALMLRGALARVILGSDFTSGPFFFTLALGTLWVASVDTTLDQYLRALKASKLIVAISLGRLLLNITLNVCLLVVFGLGLAGVLWGNLAAACAALAVRCLVFVRSRGAPALDRALARTFWRFGWPLIFTGLASAMMHEVDRYFLRVLVDLRQVGLYSIAYQIGQGVNMLFLLPFGSIWNVLVYEIAQQPSARQTFATVFKYFVFILSCMLLFAALFAGQLLTLIAPPEYAPAADLVPVICLAYFFYSLHSQFNAPAMIAGRTLALLPVFALAAAVNVVLNLALIPTIGAAGAAWASVATFVVFSGVGLLRYRRIDSYPYPFGQFAVIVVGMPATYMAVRSLSPLVPSGWLAGALAAAAWVGWAAPLLGPLVASALKTAGLFRRAPLPRPE